MSSRARGPRVLKGALVSIPQDNATPNVIAFYYNPSTLQRTLQPQMVGGDEGDRSEAVRYTSAPIEMITVEIEIDASDLLEKNDPTTVQMGIYPQLSALELLAYPTSTQVLNVQTQLNSGTMEIAPLTAPRILFIWGTKRGLPVRLMNYSINEEAFDANLNPIRATVSLNMRVLNYTDLNANTKDYHQFLSYQQSMEAMSTKAISSNGQQITGVNINAL